MKDLKGENQAQNPLNQRSYGKKLTFRHFRILHLQQRRYVVCGFRFCRILQAVKAYSFIHQSKSENKNICKRTIP